MALVAWNAQEGCLGNPFKYPHKYILHISYILENVRTCGKTFWGEGASILHTGPALPPTQWRVSSHTRRMTGHGKWRDWEILQISDFEKIWILTVLGCFGTHKLKYTNWPPWFGLVWSIWNWGNFWSYNQNRILLLIWYFSSLIILKSVFHFASASDRFKYIWICSPRTFLAGAWRWWIGPIKMQIKPRQHQNNTYYVLLKLHNKQ